MDTKRLILLLSLACSSTLAVGGGGNTTGKETLIFTKDACSLSGWWQGGLQSYMLIAEDLPRGQAIEFDGIYYVRDTNAPGALPGVQQSQASLRGARSKDYSNSFGFVVSYKGGGTGVWVGQCLPEQSKDELETVWMHRTPSPYEEQWKVARLGKNKWIKVPQPEWYKQS